MRRIANAPEARGPPNAASTSRLAAAASRGDVTALAQAASRGASAAAAAPSSGCGGSGSAVQRSLEAENVQLKRELAEVRQQLLPLLASEIPPSADSAKGAAALPASFWLEAQLQQSRRHVQLLTEALVKRAELSTELEVILLKIREQTPGGAGSGAGAESGGGGASAAAAAGAGASGAAAVRGLTPEWAAAAMRRIRSVQFAETLADELQAQQQRQPRASGRGGREAARGGRGAAARGSVALPAPGFERAKG